jgi:hypothetical protein
MIAIDKDGIQIIVADTRYSETKWVSEWGFRTESKDLIKARMGS